MRVIRIRLFHELQDRHQMVGKQVGDDIYVHFSALTACNLLPQWAQSVAERDQIPTLDGVRPNVLKLNLRDHRYSLLLYPAFDLDPFPVLLASWSYSSIEAEPPKFRRYDGSLNPPVLHRKELLVAEGFPGREDWIQLTTLAESLGLFDQTRIIGFKQNWLDLIASKGYEVRGDKLVPLANDRQPEDVDDPADNSHTGSVRRHLTALSRTALSAPVQMLLRYQILASEQSFFDYGCGRGTDVEGLISAGYNARGWDPHYAPTEPLQAADVVNLGFVINVIENLAERAEALHNAFKLTKGVLSVAVMLDGSFSGGVPFADGVLTSRQTFQKYFTQAELKDYIEHALGLSPIMVAPGIAWVFADKALEQRYLISRCRRSDMTRRLGLLAKRVVTPRRQPVERSARRSQAELRLAELKPKLDRLWKLTLDLGRWPEADELLGVREELEAVGGWSRAQRLLITRYPQHLINEAARQRRDDVLLYLITQLFSQRLRYKHLDRRLQLDVRSFFGDLQSAMSLALQHLQLAAQPTELLLASQKAVEQGLGYLDGDHDLQLHISLVERLPLLLRAYVACGLLLWDATSDVQLVKIHIQSGKMSLMEFAEENFLETALPHLRRRIKVNMRRLQCDVFEYGSSHYPMPLLLWKSRYMNEETPGFAEQQTFDEELLQTGLLGQGESNPSATTLFSCLALMRLRVDGLKLLPSNDIPELDQACGANFTYRQLIECGETQQRLKLPNVPLRPETFNALYALATEVLDPVIEYFGGIRLTYGFCSSELSKHISARVAPKLDQHASCEVNARGSLICDRGGAAVDFIVKDEDMREVAQWIIDHIPFDRLYFYGASRPLHVSYGPQASRLAYEMRPNAKGHKTPRAWQADLKSQLHSAIPRN